MKIALGTTSKNKIRLITEVLNENDFIISIYPVATESGVADQPLTSEETKLGSLNRAISALKEIPDVDYGLGLEVGYHRQDNGAYSFFCWATMVDKARVQQSERSEEFVLPEFFQHALKEGKYLIEYAKEKNAEEASLIATYREQVIKSAVKLVLLNYFKTNRF